MFINDIHWLINITLCPRSSIKNRQRRAKNGFKTVLFQTTVRYRTNFR